MSQEFLIGGALLLVPIVILAVFELHVARKRRIARDTARRSKARSPSDAA
ncbi:hypothetical protein [Croceicoccus mobilis]|nr:hypothetical protein [Croceicoccus mobilis]